jgi:hypothetical protein
MDVLQILRTNSLPLDDFGLEMDFDYTFAFMESANDHPVCLSLVRRVRATLKLKSTDRSDALRRAALISLCVQHINRATFFDRRPKKMTLG